jgi:hypothetical protein
VGQGDKGQTYTIKRADAKRNMKIHRANKNQDYAEVAVRDKRFELAAFMHKPKKLISQLLRKPKGGMSLNVLRSTGYLKVPGAFKVLGKKSGEPHIVWRKRSGGKAGGPLSPAYPVRPQAIRDGGQGAGPDHRRDAELFPQRFSHEARNVLRRWQEKGRV